MGEKHIAYLICCNDAVESVVLDDEVLAKAIIRQRIREEEDPDKLHYWHLHVIDCVA